MPIPADIAFHAARERACRTNAALARDPDIAARHQALADLHAAQRSELEDRAPEHRLRVAEFTDF